MEINVKTIGNNIARYRRQQHLTQEELAELSDLSQNFFSRVERGEVEHVSAINLIKIARALNVSIDKLVEREDEKQLPVASKRPNQAKLLKLLNKMDVSASEQISKSLVRIIHTLKNEK